MHGNRVSVYSVVALLELLGCDSPLTMLTGGPFEAGERILGLGS